MSSRGGTLHAEFGNVLTRIVSFEAADPAGRLEEVTPTTTYPPFDSPASGFEAALAATAGRLAATYEPGVALVHLNGLPRTAIFGLAGLSTTELSRQAVLRRAGSSLVQVRSTDPANLESQLIDVRARPLDILLFSVAARQAAERLMAGGGPRARVLPTIQALYNGPSEECSGLSEVLGGGVTIRQLPPVRTGNNQVDIAPTEECLRELTAQVLRSDPQFAAARDRGFRLATFSAAFTDAAEALGRFWPEVRPTPPDGSRGRGDVVACVDLGGGYTEVALAGYKDSDTLRFVDDALGAVSGLQRDEAASGVGRSGLIDSDSLAEWLPFAISAGELADALANHTRRPFSFPSTWGQLLLLAGLGRLRLQRTRTESRGMISADWRSTAGALVVGGGYFRCLPGPALALGLVLDGLQPLGVTEVYCDRAGLAPIAAASGDLTAWPDERWVARLATVVAPSNLSLDWRRPHEDDLLALVTVQRQGSPKTTFRIVPGSLFRFPLRNGERARIDVHPVREHDFGAGPGKLWSGEVTGGRCGLVFDARGRPVSLPRDPEVRRSKLREWINALDVSLGWGDDR